MGNISPLIGVLIILLSNVILHLSDIEQYNIQSQPKESQAKRSGELEAICIEVNGNIAILRFCKTGSIHVFIGM